MTLSKGFEEHFRCIACTPAPDGVLRVFKPAAEEERFSVLRLRAGARGADIFHKKGFLQRSYF